MHLYGVFACLVQKQNHHETRKCIFIGSIHDDSSNRNVLVVCLIHQDFQHLSRVAGKAEEVARRLKLLRGSPCSVLTCQKLTLTQMSFLPTLVTANTWNAMLSS